MDDPEIISQPSFDPGLHGRLYQGIRRGRRFWFLVGAVILIAGGAIVAQRLVANWTPAAKAKEKAVEVSKAQPAVYKVDPQPDIVPVNLPVRPPETIQVQAPPMPQPQAEAPQIRPAPAPRTQARKQPTEIAWNVKVQGEPNKDWFMDGQRPMLAKGCALRPGASLIPAVLNTVVQSEIPGQVIATVSEDVFDSDGVGRLLIPQGTKLVGIYKSDLTLGSRRLGMMWTELTMPNGRQLALADSNGMDVAGSMGVGGTVTTAWGQVIATAALFSIFDVAQRSFEGDDYASEVGASAANQFSRTGQQVIKQMLEQAVKIRIPAGTQIVASPGKTIRVC